DSNIALEPKRVTEPNEWSSARLMSFRLCDHGCPTPRNQDNLSLRIVPGANEKSSGSQWWEFPTYESTQSVWNRRCGFGVCPVVAIRDPGGNPDGFSDERRTGSNPDELGLCQDLQFEAGFVFPGRVHTGDAVSGIAREAGRNC